jgi:hypothetical protein
MDELQALKNAAANVNLFVFEDPQTDRRVKKRKYFLTTTELKTVSPVLNYDRLNHFILGFIEASKLLNF